MLSIANAYRRYALTLRQINEMAKRNPAELINSIESAYREDVRDIARSLCKSTGDGCAVVMLAGPSASGKTTTAKMLQEELLTLGCGSEIISMDNFYLGEENVPRTSDGKPDFETVYALNIPQIESCIQSLLCVGECDIAQFDFSLSKPRKETLHIDLTGDCVAIIEGIHALNPIFTRHIKQTHGLKKMYISVKQGIRGFAADYALSAQEVRLLRRLVRDYKFRCSSAEHTLGMWDNVIRSEEVNIAPYKYESDITLNSIHIYEPCVTAQFAIPILSEIPRSSELYDYSRELMERAYEFEAIDEELVPQNSLIREFIGNGKYSY